MSHRACKVLAGLVGLLGLLAIAPVSVASAASVTPGLTLSQPATQAGSMQSLGQNATFAYSSSGDSVKNLTLTLPVTFPEAALGAEVRIPTPDGAPVTVRIPAGTSSGKRLRVRGRGMPRSGGDRGDLLVTVDVTVPDRLDPAARKALQEYAEHAGDDPRSHLTAMLGH